MPKCPDCEEPFDTAHGLGIHLGKSDCERPDLSERQKQIAKGLLMGDAWIHPDGQLELDINSEAFVQWVADEFSELNPSITEISREPDKHQDGYRLRLMKTRFFEQLRGWYDSGRKEFPDNLELTPLILKVWYCCDGCLEVSGRPWIACENERGYTKKLKSYFDDTPMDPAVYDSQNVIIAFRADDQEDFFEWIGEPVPGYEYKWRNDNE